MKIETTKDNTFRPVTVSVTFETQEELEAVNTIMGYNQSIPEFIEKSIPRFTPKQIKIFTDFMSVFYRATV